jgi:serine kinase of HPr protein (carbohydrate metabolism regulator)
MATIHASAVLVGARAILVRGPSGSGKSRLVLDLLDRFAGGGPPFARLVADDRVEVEAAHGRLLARAPQPLAGLVEIRGLGIRQVAYEPVAVVGLVVDIDVPDAARMPEEDALSTTLAGVTLPRHPMVAGAAGLPAILARCQWLAGLPALVAALH